MAGTRPGGPIAAGWAVLQHLGEDGYLRLADDAWRAAAALRGAIGSTPGIALRGAPDATVLAFGDDGSGAVDTFALGDALVDRGGWFFDRQTPPDSLHATVHAGHLAVVDELWPTWRRPRPTLAGTGGRATDRSARYGSVVAGTGRPETVGAGAAGRCRGRTAWSIHAPTGAQGGSDRDRGRQSAD